jgi:hypothetical protein
MTYNDWESLLQNPELRRVLINGGADKAIVGEAINKVRQALIEKQSLLTLSSR